MNCLNMFKLSIVFTEHVEFRLLAFLKDFTAVIVFACHILKFSFFSIDCSYIPFVDF